MPAATTQTPAPNTVLAGLFAAHGVAAQDGGDFVAFPGHAAAAAAEMFFSDDRLTATLNVRFAVSESFVIEEIVLGIAETPQAAINQAWQNFCDGVLHVLLAAFFDKTNPQIEVERWTFPDGEREIILGGMLTRTTAPIDGLATTAWFETFRTALSKEPLPDGPTAVRVFCAHVGPRRLELETLVNNQPSSTLAAALDTAAWPTHDGFLSVRLFAIVRPRVTP